MSRRVVAGLVLGAAAAATGFQFQRWFSEQPQYEVLRSAGEFEIRRYAPRVVASTAMTDGEGKDQGFRVLAGYIFGGNGGDRRIAMTSPVETDAEEGMQIAMTSPVETGSGAAGREMRFVMPSEYTLDDLPIPNDERVVLSEQPAEVVAALRVRGRPSEAEFRAHVREALRMAQEAGLDIDGEPRVAQYDPPWTLAWFRRNEVLIPLSGS